MKKFFALLLAAAMTFACAGALAATDVVIDTGLPEFDVHFTSDEDIEVSSVVADGYCAVAFGDPDYEDPNAMIWLATITISDDTIFEGKDLKDATDEELQRLFDGLVVADADGVNPYTYEVKDLDDGVRALSIVNQDTHEEAWAFTVQQGVLVQVIGFYVDNRAVTDEDIEKAVQLMDAFQFVPVESAEQTK